MTKDEILDQMGMSREELETAITELALEFSTVAKTSDLHPILVVDAILRFASSMVFGIALAAGKVESASELAGFFVAQFNSYMEQINDQKESIFADAPPAVTELAAQLGLNINPNGYTA